MYARTVLKRSPHRGVWILSAVLSALAVPCALAQAAPAANDKQLAAPAAKPPQFEAATIKPVRTPDPNRMHDQEEGRRFTTHYTTLGDLILMAYHLDRRQIVGGPAWVTADEYDVDAVAEDEAQFQANAQAMLQQLLADRFKLVFHREQREQSVYVLTVAKGGPKLKAADANGPHNSGCERLGDCTFTGDTLEHFARWMGFGVVDRPVVDKTGLTGEYDFTLKWTPDETQFAAMGIHVPVPAADNPNAPPGLFTAVQEQLGLKLDSQKVANEVFVIDQVERPVED